MKSHDLIKAARVKIQNGWVQGYLYHPDGEGNPRYCVMGALQSVAGELDLRPETCEVAVRRVARFVQHRHHFSVLTPSDGVVMAFNDGITIDHADVLAVLDEAGGGK